MDDLRNDKASIESVQILKQRLDGFQELEHVEYLTNVLIPKLEKFSIKCDYLTESNDEMKSIVRKFDETMMSKANKSNLSVMQKEMA